MPRSQINKPELASPPKELDPASLSQEDQEAVVEFYMGCHPKYYVYQGLQLNVDIYSMNRDGVKGFNGFKPHKRQLGIE